MRLQTFSPHELIPKGLFLVRRDICRDVAYYAPWWYAIPVRLWIKAWHWLWWKMASPTQKEAFAMRVYERGKSWDDLTKKAKR